jgi:hypothetical protein
LVYLLFFHAYINEMHDSRSKIPSKKYRPYIYEVKFLALLGASYIYISRLRVKPEVCTLPRPRPPLVSSPMRENSHGRTGNLILDLMSSSQESRPPDHETGKFIKCN